MRRNTVLIWVGAITLSRGGGGEQVKDAGWCTPRLGEHAKCFKAEENARGREQPDKRWKTEREWWTWRWDSLRSDVEKQGWLWMGGKIGQCKQSSWQPLCRWEKHVGAFKSVQINREPISHARQGHPRRWLKPGVLFAVRRRDGASSKTWPNNPTALRVERSAIQDWSLMSRASLF